MPTVSKGWAYVSCSSGGGSASGKGPAGSVQYTTGSDGGISGSARLLFATGSNNLYLTGGLYVSGVIEAKNFDIINHTVTYLSSSGDSKFGDTNTDLHQFTGSLTVSKVGTNPSVIYVDAANSKMGILTNTPPASFSNSGSMAVNFVSTTSSPISVSASDYMIISPNGTATLINLPAAATAGRGRVIVVKAAHATPSLTVSASSGETIDGASYSLLLSAYSSETYVCDGSSKWSII